MLGAGWTGGQAWGQPLPLRDPLRPIHLHIFLTSPEFKALPGKMLPSPQPWESSALLWSHSEASCPNEGNLCSCMRPQGPPEGGPPGCRQGARNWPVTDL